MPDIDAASSGPTLDRATFATFEKFVEGLPPTEKVSVYKLYELARKGELPVYRLPGVKSACVMVTEARTVLASLTAQGKIRRGYGSFGPEAVVRDLSNVIGQDFEVLR